MLYVLYNELFTISLVEKIPLQYSAVLEKTPAYRWTHEIQSHVVQGSAVFILLKYYNKVK